MKKKLTIAICISLILTAITCGCNSQNIDNFYGSSSSADQNKTSAGSKAEDSSQTSEKENDVTKDYSLEIPTYEQYFQLGEYKNLKYYINEDLYKVSENMILSQMASELSLSQKEVADRAAELGDTVNLNFHGTIDGKDFEGNKAENYETILGKGKLSEQFEENIVGMKSGETKKVKYTFPEQYNNTGLAGKTADFEIKLNSIKAYDEKDITDELVSSKTTYKTMNEYKKAVEKKLKEDMEYQRKTAIASYVIDQIINNATISGYDEDYIALLMDSAKQTTKDAATKANLSEEEYVKKQYGAESYDSYIESLRPTAEDYMRSMMAISAIAYAENLNVTDEEYQNQLKKYQDEYNVTIDQLNKYYTSEDIIFAILLTKVQDWIVNNSVQVDSPEKL